jgi:hypothetical protein
MSTVLEPIWLPEVRAEYYKLLQGRDDGADVGSQIRAFVKLTGAWNDAEWRYIEPVGSAYLYGMYARYATMFFAVCKPRAAVVKWTETGNEHEQSMAREEAKSRASALFP